jgi:hypothetical protein
MFIVKIPISYSSLFFIYKNIYIYIYFFINNMIFQVKI